VLHKILMPKLGLTMTEGQIAEWLVPVRSPFRTGQGLFVVETDKVATEIAAEGDGVLTDVAVPVGETVPVGEVIGYCQDGAAEEMPSGPSAAAGSSTSPSAEVAVSTAPPAVPMPPAAQAQHADSSAASRRVPVTPLPRRLAKQLGVDLATVEGSGPNGRVKAADVQAAANSSAAPVAAHPFAAHPVAGQPAASAAIDLGSRSSPGPVQAAMARRLTAVKQQVPHFYLAVEAHVSRLLALRAELNALDGPVRFTLNHFILAAVGRALGDLPQANRVWDDGEIVTFTSTDVGMAVSTERGLFVPVVREAGRVSLAEVARRAQAHVERARSGVLDRDDMAGGAITVSNAGMFNVKFMTPIINPGQSMILGVGSVSQVFRPDADGRPELRDEIGLVLAADHRLMDGVSGLAFLNRVSAYLEQPMRLLAGA
jgi:pyruvate dehydrogenase E2 component (dihydrolipoamide acetyltransferase)